jgi:hypothetical protein
LLFDIKSFHDHSSSAVSGISPRAIASAYNNVFIVA